MNSETADELRDLFVSFFAYPNGRCKSPEIVGEGRKILPTCRKIMAMQDPFLLPTIIEWDEKGGLKPRVGPPARRLNLGLGLLSVGLWEGAWAVGQLHYDQLQKEEAKTNQRLHKGHPACELAILAREIGSPSLSRQYALLSSAGDVYWEHKEPELTLGGFGPTLLEQFESNSQQNVWRQHVRECLGQFDQSKPIYLEALVAAQWFGKAYADRFLDLAHVADQGGNSFVEVLLEAVQAPGNASHAITGTRFEAAAALLFSTSPGFEVRSARETSDEQVDFVVRYSPDQLANLPLRAGPGLVECKSSEESVSAKELRDFGAKCQFHRVGFGILVARKGISGLPEERSSEATRAELVRRRLLIDGLPILVVRANDLFRKARELRGLQDVLAADYERLVFGPIAGETET